MIVLDYGTQGKEAKESTVILAARKILGSDFGDSFLAPGPKLELETCQKIPTQSIVKVIFNV